VLERWQRYDAALAAYEQAYTLRPDDVSGLLAAAEMLVKLDRIDEAAARLEEKATYFENNTALRVELGHLHALRRQYAAAVRRFREASLLSPEDRTITEYLALSLAADGRHGDAVEHLLRLLEEEKKAGDRDDLRLVLGDCYMAIRKPVDARTQFVQIVDRHPTQVNAWIKLGQAALVVGDVNRLNQAAERAVALAPQRPEGHLLRGMARQQAGDHDAAIEAFDAAARLSPESAEPLLLKGISFERAGDHRAAVDAYQQALRVAPADARAQRLLAGVADN
jgi:tetratricopeptide (TPR) repeat protein